MGSIVGTAWWAGCIATTCWLVSDIGAGRASTLGDVSMSVSLDESAAWVRVMCLVCTIIVTLVLRRLQKGLKRGF
jgi:hypothetical protein